MTPGKNKYSISVRYLCPSVRDPQNFVLRVFLLFGEDDILYYVFNVEFLTKSTKALDFSANWNRLIIDHSVSYKSDTKDHFSERKMKVKWEGKV